MRDLAALSDTSRVLRPTPTLCAVEYADGIPLAMKRPRVGVRSRAACSVFGVRCSVFGSSTELADRRAEPAALVGGGGLR